MKGAIAEKVKVEKMKPVKVKVKGKGKYATTRLIVMMHEFFKTKNTKPTGGLLPN